jgi:GTPase SAR1 family protein
MRPDNLLIIGASNNGKTAIARRFMRSKCCRKTRRLSGPISPWR